MFKPYLHLTSQGVVQFIHTKEVFGMLVRVFRELECIWRVGWGIWEYLISMNEDMKSGRVEIFISNQNSSHKYILIICIVSKFDYLSHTSVAPYFQNHII